MTKSEVLPIISNDRYPWDLIELDYRAGFLPVAGICSKYGVSMERLQYTIRKHNWKRRELTADDVYGPDIAPVGPGQIPISESEVRAVQRMQVGAVVKSHRAMIARARGQTEELLVRVGAVMLGQPKTIRNEDGEEIVLPVMSPRESPAELLDKLSRVMVRLIGLERQSYGLDVMQEPHFDQPNGEAGAEAKSRLDSVLEKIDQIARDKRAEGKAQ